MKCINCGAENLDLARFCVSCGSAIVPVSQSQQFSKQTRSSNDLTQDIPDFRNEYAPNNAQYSYISEAYQQDAVCLPESAEPPKKKKKAGKIIAIIIVVLLLIGIGVGGYFAVSSGLLEIKINKNFNQELPEPVAQVINLNTPIHQAGTVEISLYDKYIQAGAVLPTEKPKDYETPLPDDSGSKYFVVIVNVKNVTKNNIDFNNTYIECNIEGKDYTINYSKDVKVYYEIADGTEFSRNATIKPNETKKVYFVCPVSNNYADTYKSFILNFGFDSKLSSKPINKGFEACDYIFKFAA